MRFEFELTYEEYYYAYRAHYRRQSSWKQQFHPITMVGSFATTAGWLFLFDRPDGGGWAVSVLLLIVGIFTMFYPWLARHRQMGHLRRAVEHMLIKKEWEIGDEFIRETSPFYQATYGWQMFTRWVDSPKVLLLYIAPSSYLVFPKRIFRDQEELSQFINMLKTKILPKVGGFPVQLAASRE